MSIQPFHGCSLIKRPRISKAVLLPDGGTLVLFTAYEDGSRLSLEDINRNVCRLDAEGNQVWQVRRDDTNLPPDWWQTLHYYARLAGHDGAREPFTDIWVESPDGSYQSDANGHTPADVQHWVEGCRLYLSGSALQHYVLDPEAGVARNITERPVRPLTK
jgi:hypothetical protein